MVTMRLFQSQMRTKCQSLNPQSSGFRFMPQKTTNYHGKLCNLMGLENTFQWVCVAKSD